MSDPLEQYRRVLNVTVDATLDDINTAYYQCLEKIPENPTEEEQQLQHRLRHAYSVLKRNYEPPKRAMVLLNKRRLIPALGVLLVGLVSVLLVMNWSNIRMMVTRYEPGEVLRWRNQQTPYGKVVAYDEEHSFHAGRPSAAYQIRLLQEDRMVWLSERLVVKGMVPVDPAGIDAAGFTSPEP